MHSLRTRVFVTVAVLVSAAAGAAALLSRRATLVEEQRMHIVVAERAGSLDALGAEVQRAYAAGGWTAVQTALARRSGGRERFVAVDGAGHIAAASDPELAAGQVEAASSGGALTVRIDRGSAVARIEVRGVDTIPVRAASGLEIGRLFVLPQADSEALTFSRPMIPPWATATLGTVAIAVCITFALSGRILRPVSDLTQAAVRMRDGDLDVRVRPSGDGEIARLGQAFNAMAERLAQNERAKRHLMSDVAHELRSPVTNLRCGLEAIQDGLAPGDPARINALYTETLLLQRLIGDLQDLALAESGGLALHIAVIDLDTVVRRAAGHEPTPEVSIAIEPSARFVRADEGRLEQMLRNLLSNARRHTPPEGRITISSTRHAAADSVQLTVSDTGSGIPAEHLPHVFDRFYRVDESRDRATGGAGLGLAIVRRLAEAQGGSVSASSAGAGLGAAFTLEMPAANPADPSRAAPDATAPVAT